MPEIFFLLCLVRLCFSSTHFSCELIIVCFRWIGWKFGLGGMKYPCTWPAALVHRRETRFVIGQNTGRVCDAPLNGVHTYRYIRRSCGLVQR